jgi:hypothetical protein
VVILPVWYVTPSEGSLGAERSRTWILAAG